MPDCSQASASTTSSGLCCSLRLSMLYPWTRNSTAPTPSAAPSWLSQEQSLGRRPPAQPATEHCASSAGPQLTLASAVGRSRCAAQAAKLFVVQDVCSQKMQLTVTCRSVSMSWVQLQRGQGVQCLSVQLSAGADDLPPSVQRHSSCVRSPYDACSDKMLGCLGASISLLAPVAPLIPPSWAMSVC